jgi:multidrug efflux system outer membrane protein
LAAKHTTREPVQRTCQRLEHRGGVDTQLDALDADRDLFSAELSLSQIQLSEVLTVIELYKALGGGWQ